MQYLTRSLQALVRTPSGKASLETLSLGLVKGRFDEVLEKKSEFLHKQEERVFAGYAFDLKRHSYLLGRLAAKKALNGYEEGRCNENEYLVVNGCIGQPVVLNKNLHLSIAHTDSWGIAVASSPLLTMGIDIECPAHFENIKPSIFTDQERHLFLDKSDENENHCLLWSAKEALVKLLKTGFTLPFPLLEIASIEFSKEAYTVTFKNFSAFRILLFRAPRLIVGISFHKGVEIINTSKLHQAIHELYT